MDERDSLTSLRDLIGSAGHGLGLFDPVATGRLWARWGEIVGAGVAAHAEPTSLREGVLRVRADSPAWATEIAFLREEIRRQANEELGRELVTEVRVWTGPGVVGKETHGHRASPQKEGRREEVPVDPEAALRRARRAWERRRGSRRMPPETG
ncbi:hypothetical protein BH18ACT15_BH18ACT15_14880 [soil metagenome]